MSWFTNFQSFGLLLPLAASLVVVPALAAEQTAVQVDANHLVIQVNGMVCSFCAHGAEKSLSRLKILDNSEFGDGVFVDIHKHQIILALVPGSSLPIRDIVRRIKKAGYDPITIHIRVKGIAIKHHHAIILESSAGQHFEVVAHGTLALPEGEAVEVQAHLDAQTIPELEEASPLPIQIDKRFGGVVR